MVANPEFPSRRSITRQVLLCLVLLLGGNGCAMQKWALGKVSRAVTSDGGIVFSGDDDPELVAAALPFALKTYESLLASRPGDEQLLTATAKSFCMYSYAFVHLDADTVSDVRLSYRTHQYQRAKRLYLRARGYGLRALELRHPGFSDLLETNQTDSAIALLRPQDSTQIYWTAMAWMGAFTTDKFDMALATDHKKAVAMMQKLLQINPGYGEGAVHEFFLSYYGALPESMGGSEQKARGHFKDALACAREPKAAPYVSLATSVCISRQYAEEFSELLNKALAIDPDAVPANRLATLLSQARARWLLEHRADFFLTDDTPTEE